MGVAIEAVEVFEDSLPEMEKQDCLQMNLITV